MAISKQQLIAYVEQVAIKHGLPMSISWAYNQPAVYHRSGSALTTRDTKTNVYWQMRAIDNALLCVKLEKGE